MVSIPVTNDANVENAPNNAAKRGTEKNIFDFDDKTYYPNLK